MEVHNSPAVMINAVFGLIPEKHVKMLTVKHFSWATYH